MTSADDDAAHGRPIEHPPERHRADADVVPRGDTVKDGEQLLESHPPAELLDDEPVLHERPVLQRLGRFWMPEVAFREKSSGERAIAE